MTDDKVDTDLVDLRDVPLSRAGSMGEATETLKRVLPQKDSKGKPIKTVEVAAFQSSI